MSVRSTPGTLGCGEYTAVVQQRGGGKALAVLDGITSVEWDRRTDAPSEATVKAQTSQLGAGCCGFLSSVRSWAHELALYRTVPGRRPQRVWEGPLMRPEESNLSGELTLHAFDVLEWTKVRVNHTDWRFTGTGALDASTMVAYMIGDAFLPDDPNVMKHMILSRSADTVERDVSAETVICWTSIAELCKTLVDVTTVGRRIIVCPEGNPPWDLVIRLGPDHFLGDVVIGQDGAEYYNRCVVSGKGVTRSAIRTPAGLIKPDDTGAPLSAADVDDFHGLVEQLLTLQDVTSDGEAYASAVAALQVSTMPAYLRASDKGQLSPAAPVTIDQLVPNTQMDILLADSFCLDLPAPPLLQLARLDVTWTPGGGEKVGISVDAVAPGAIAPSAS